MKAIKVTTAEGKSLTAGLEDAYWISVEYRIFPKKNIAEYNVHAVVLSPKSKEIYHEWTPSEPNSQNLKLEMIDTDSVDPPLRNRPSTHRWNSEDELEPFCSFCGRFPSQVNNLIAGYTGHICDECIQICSDTLAEIKNDGA